MDVEAALRRFFEERPEGIVAAYLYGSVARGTDRPDSDVDVAVLFAEKPPSSLDSPVYAIQVALELTLRRPVQVVALNTAPILLVHRVLRDGKILFEGDRSRRVRFQVAKMNEYWDFKPVLDRIARRERAPR